MFDFNGMIRIVEYSSKGVSEDRRCFIERDAMLV